MADVIIFPVMRVEKGDVTMIQVEIGQQTFRRLRKRAEEWNVPTHEAAAFVIEQALAPRKK